MLVIVLFPVALLLAGAVAEWWRGSTGLSRFLADNERRGEQLNLAPLIPSKVPDNENAAIPLLELTNQLREAHEVLELGPPMLRFPRPGFAQRARDVTTWERRRTTSFDPVATNSWPEFAGKLSELKSLLEQVNDALKRPSFRAGYDYQRGFKDTTMFPLLVETKVASQLLACEVFTAARSGSEAHAKTNLLMLLRWHHQLSGQKLIIAELIRLTSFEVAIGALWQGLHLSSWTDAELDEIQSLLTRLEFVDSMISAFELERAMILDLYRALKADSSVRKRQFEQWQKIYEMIGTGFLPEPNWLMENLRLPLWSWIWAEQDCLRALHRWNVSLDGLRLMREHNWQTFSRQWTALEKAHAAELASAEELGVLDRWRYLFSRDSFLFASGTARKVMKMETLRRIAVVAIGIQRFQLASARLPGSLAELTPKFLDKVPADPMCGSPLRYRLESQSSFRLWSVGEDGRDDDGDPRPEQDDKSYNTIWDGRDAVWPMLAN